LADKTTEFSGHVVTISNGNANLRIPVTGLGVTYDTQNAARLAYQYGRQGSWTTKITEQLRALLGRPSDFSAYSYDGSRLVPYVVQLDEDLVTPVTDASLSFDSDHPQVTPSQPGVRLDLGRLTWLVSDRLARTSAEAITAPVYDLAPALNTASLTAVTDQLGGYLSGPITLTYSGVESEVDQKTIISWIQVGSRPAKSFVITHDLTDLYPPPASAHVELAMAAVQKYVADLAGNIDQTPENAGLALQNGQLA